jgi:single-strand DNA-binding protein
MSIANITIIGNVGADPETRYTQNGVMYVSFNVAVNSRRTDASGQQQEITNWFRVTAWRRLAETLDNLTQQGALRKGRQVYVQGRFEARDWTNQEGQTRTGLNVTASEFQLLGTRADAEGQAPQRRDFSSDAQAGDPGSYEPQDIDDIPF